MNEYQKPRSLPQLSAAFEGFAYRCAFVVVCLGFLSIMMWRSSTRANAAAFAISWAVISIGLVLVLAAAAQLWRQIRRAQYSADMFSDILNHEHLCSAALEKRIAALELDREAIMAERDRLRKGSEELIAEKNELLKRLPG